MLNAEQKTFGAPCNDTNWPPGLFCQQHSRGFQFAIELAAEPATESEDDHAHVSERNFEDASNLALNHVGILSARPDGDAAVGNLRDGDMRLKRDVVHRRRQVGVLKNLVGLAKALSDMAFALLE